MNIRLLIISIQLQLLLYTHILDYNYLILVNDYIINYLSNQLQMSIGC